MIPRSTFSGIPRLAYASMVFFRSSPSSVGSSRRKSTTESALLTFPMNTSVSATSTAPRLPELLMPFPRSQKTLWKPSASFSRPSLAWYFGTVGLGDRLRRDHEEARLTRPLQVVGDALRARELATAVPAQVLLQLERVPPLDAEPSRRAARRVVHVDHDAVPLDRLGEEQTRGRRSRRLPARALAVQEGVDLLRPAQTPELVEGGPVAAAQSRPNEPLHRVADVRTEHDHRVEAASVCRHLGLVIPRRRAGMPMLLGRDDILIARRSHISGPHVRRLGPLEDGGDQPFVL